MKKIYILSGAGLSAESGIRTFRNSNDGLWAEHKIEEVCSVQGWEDDREKVSDFYDMIRADIESKEPNHAHKELALLKDKYPKNIIMLTQNVDNMLEKAGCKEVIHLHGTLTDLRCENCGKVFYIGYEEQEGKSCPACESDDIRHNVVMFGEAVPAYTHLIKMYDEADMVVVIGTSGQVINTADIAQNIENSILNNLDEDPTIDQYFRIQIYAPATEGINEIVSLIEEFLEE